MKKACFGLVLLAGLSVAGTASAADNTVVGVGTGAVAGALVAGPVGAVVGAVAGGVIGSNTPSVRRRHARRSRYAYRRRAEAPAALHRARFADRGPATAGASRPRASGSEISTQPQVPAQKGWSDPN